MPNIEIHGFEKEVAELWREQIFKAAENKSFWGEDIAVTIYPTEVKGINNDDTPFIRLASTVDEIKEALEMLKAFKIDIEVLILNQFIKGAGNFKRHSPPRTNY